MSGQHSFFDDQRTQDAVLQRLETLTDAASHLSADLKNRNPQIPWRTITAFRNAMAHPYVDIRYEQVWKTIQDDLPKLKLAVELELRSLKADGPSVRGDESTN